MKRTGMNKMMMVGFLGATALMVMAKCKTPGELGNVSAGNEISFFHDVKPIMDNYCITCHSGDSPRANLSLTTYESVRGKTEKGNLLKRINDHTNPMPQSGLLPKYLRQTIQKWADGGFVKGNETAMEETTNYGEFTPPVIEAVDINTKGFDLLEKMQGHWVGSYQDHGAEL